MRTTLDLPEELFKQLKMIAVSEGKTLQAVLRETIEARLLHGAAQRIRRTPFSGTIRGKTGPAMKRMSNEVIASLED